ncbi:MAG: disulfide bond formation protein B [Gemmatimonadetes bacterium]|nr:disulfide bond formation protein B [Gemmatimonadota bacterium]
MLLYALVVQTLAGATLLSFVIALALLGTLTVPGGRTRLRGALGGQERHPIAWAWIVAAVAAAGSLYFSDGVGLVPCLLCWYQRILMYPLVLVLAVGWARSDAGVWRYGLPLALVGLAVSAYHRVLQARPSLELVQCGTGPPCTGRYLNVFGFVTIPTMAGAAFLLIIALLATLRILEPPETGSPTE